MAWDFTVYETIWNIWLKETIDFQALLLCAIHPSTILTLLHVSLFHFPFSTFHLFFLLPLSLPSYRYFSFFFFRGATYLIVASHFSFPSFMQKTTYFTHSYLLSAALFNIYIYLYIYLYFWQYSGLKWTPYRKREREAA